jgi:hypothetical protein
MKKELGLEGLPDASDGSCNSQIDMSEDQIKIHYQCKNLIRGVNLVIGESCMNPEILL